ncbi:MAG: hypothetical protein QOH12_3376 [Solirubrobacteraceae bacterium]|jgi:hypothetical protein|nr:hypothetical protein [Solirubrobacteraceae bacterium]
MHRWRFAVEPVGIEGPVEKAVVGQLVQGTLAARVLIAKQAAPSTARSFIRGRDVGRARS